MRVKIISTGSCEPEHVVTNDDLSRTLDTSDEWISSRTGIRERRIAEDCSTTRIAIHAAQRAFAGLEATEGAAALRPEELDLIIVGTSTPDKNFPSCACEVQGALGAVNAAAFDLSAACTGFLFAFNTAASYLKAGLARTALVIGADTLSKTLDWTDRSSCVLFGDGAGAVLLRAEAESAEEAETQPSDLLSVCMGADGARSGVLCCDIRYYNTPEGVDVRNTVQMDGQEVFKFAVKTVASTIRQAVAQNAGAEVSEEALARALDGVKYFVLHQANIRIIEAAAKRLNQPMEKFPVNLERYGNTSGASIPILLDELNRAGKLKRGDRLVLAGFGAGLTYGASLIVY